MACVPARVDVLIDCPVAQTYRRPCRGALVDHERVLVGGDSALNRGEVRQLVARGLREARGSYRRLLYLWQLPGEQYQKFMDFLRHHQLKPRTLGEEP